MNEEDYDTCGISLNLSRNATRHRFEVRCKDPDGVEVLAGWVKDPVENGHIEEFIKSLGGTDVRLVDMEPPDEKGMISFSGELVSAILRGRKTQTRRVMPLQPQHAGSTLPKRGVLPETAYYVHEGKVQRYLPCDFPHDICEYGGVGDRLQIWDYTKEGEPIILQITALRAEKLQNISELDCEAEGLERLQGGIRAEYANLWDSFYSETWRSWFNNPWVWVIDFKLLTLNEEDAR